MLRTTYPYYLANRPVHGAKVIDVTDKFTGELASRVALADDATIDAAIGAAARAREAMAALPPYRRQEILEQIGGMLRERAEELAHVLCIEAGKPIRDSRGEVARAIETFKCAAEESVRMSGEVQNLQTSPRTHGYHGIWKRVPVGICSFISPFNFPLNLVAHKVAPALAVGCPFVLKPASLTPISALILGEILANCDLPIGAFSILPCQREGAERFTIDERIQLLSFTGSPEVGWRLKAMAGKKRVVLELGGNAACIVDEDANLDDAVARIILGAFYQSGQSCIGVQRILAHERIMPTLRARLVLATEALAMGDPKLESTFIGPLITEGDAKRLERAVAEAVNAGATLLCGGTRTGQFLAPTLLENAPHHLEVCAKEAFGPVAVLSSFSDFEAALREVNASAYGLQAGVFTNDLTKVQRAFQVLEVGAVIIGDVPSWRSDVMPYGGVKDSGLGREGVRFAMEEMTEMRLLVIRDAPHKLP
ncbi:MAG TPA: aldehyde dehydrogenase family protein [Planctomycetota bacterium]|nr:aldehyde dehydrogenase family protein [Planctomycetota bacterium]